MKVLPGERTDGSGKICIHLFVADKKGPFTEPHCLHVEDVEGKQQLVTKPTRGRLACDPKRLVAPIERKGVTTITMRTDDPRATTCPKCIASKDYARILKVLTDAAVGIPDTVTKEE